MKHDIFSNRRDLLNAFFDDHALDAILFSNLKNIRYLSGFTGSEGALLVNRESAWLLCDSRYTSQANTETIGVDVRQFSEKQDAIRNLIDEHRFYRIGFESAYTTVSAFSELSAKLHGCELVPIGSKLDQIRMIKDEQELTLLGSVAALASDALSNVLELLRPGISEAELARELEFEMRRRGAEGRAFDFIVASGERGAMPHGRATDKLIKSGELVTIDFGAVMAGYHSDETVSIAVGEPDSRCREIYAVVKEAHDLAISAVKPGMLCCELDAIARNYIRDSGYGDFFGHGLGHGLGLEIHEKPTISPRSNMEIVEGMVFTIEPGIYIPGFGGVRIEDTISVVAGGCCLLTRFSKELLIV